MFKQVSSVATGILFGLGYLVAVIAAFSIVLFVILEWAKTPQAGPPAFNLAVICSILGGFALTCSGIDQFAPSHGGLRKVGALFFLSAVSFVVLLIWVSAAEVFSQWLPSTAIGVIGAIALVGGAFSMDGKGSYSDNLFIERLWRTVKYEEVYLKAYRDGNEAREALADYFWFYNNQRPHQGLGYRTPATVYNSGCQDKPAAGLAAPINQRKTAGLHLNPAPVLS